MQKNTKKNATVTTLNINTKTIVNKAMYVSYQSKKCQKCEKQRQFTKQTNKLHIEKNSYKKVTKIYRPFAI